MPLRNTDYLNGGGGDGASLAGAVVVVVVVVVVTCPVSCRARSYESGPGSGL
ncbi:MAG: hypothetical protein ACJ8M1_01240 [Chthoniobacterales bacterium]